MPQLKQRLAAIKACLLVKMLLADEDMTRDFFLKWARFSSLNPTTSLTILRFDEPSFDTLL